MANNAGWIPGENEEPNFMQQCLDDLLFELMDLLTSQGNRFKESLRNFLVRYRFVEAAKAIWSLVQKYPLLGLCLAAIIYCQSIPFLMFILFTLGTAVTTFTGFVVIEGTLISVAAMMVIGVLIGFSSLVGSWLLAFFVGFYSIRELWDRGQRWRRQVFRRSGSN